MHRNGIDVVVARRVCVSDNSRVGGTAFVIANAFLFTVDSDAVGANILETKASVSPLQLPSAIKEHYRSLEQRGTLSAPMGMAVLEQVCSARSLG